MIYPGTLYRNIDNLKIRGTIHFTWAYSAGFDFDLPKGETFRVSCFADPDEEFFQVWLDKPDKYEDQIVGEYLTSPKYHSYSLLLTKKQIETYCESLVDFSEAIYFYSSKEAYGEFSNFAEFGFEYQGKYYPTVEHFYQSQKYSDVAYSEKIRRASTPKLASDLGKNRKYALMDRWDKMRKEVMFLGVKLKFQACAEIQNSLLATGDRLLIENSPYDKYWGIGQNGSGYNYLGIMLMRVRKMLETERSIPS